MEDLLIKLQPFLKNKQINKHLGKNWLAKHQEILFTEMFGEEPIQYLKARKDTETRRQLSKVIMTKGVFCSEAKQLKAIINLNEQAQLNPEYQNWHIKKEEFLGQFIIINEAQSFYNSPKIDALVIARRLFEKALIEIEEDKQEKQFAKTSAKNLSEKTSPDYSAWVVENIFGKPESPEWITNEEGQVFYAGMDLDAVILDHLGVNISQTKKKQFLEGSFTVGYRYWKTNSKGQLAPPLISYAGGFWAPGVNKCQGAWSKNNGTGLYAFAHNPKIICPKNYFNITTGKKGTKRVPITACCMWENKSKDKTYVVAKYASPAAILILPEDNQKTINSMEKIAELYHLEIVSNAKDLKKAAEKWHKKTLPLFFP